VILRRAEQSLCRNENCGQGCRKSRMHGAQQTWVVWIDRLLRRALHAWRWPWEGSELCAPSQNPFLWGGGGILDIGQWTLLFEFPPYSSMRSIYRMDIWTMDIPIFISKFLHSSMQSIYTMDVWTLDITVFISSYSSMDFIFIITRVAVDTNKCKNPMSNVQMSNVFIGIEMCKERFSLQGAEFMFD
jgi:hypothetical protein